MSDKETSLDEMTDTTEEATNDAEAVVEETPSDQANYEALKAECDELSNQLVRTQADMQNMIKRHKRDREATLKYQSQALARDIIPAIDNLERALQTSTEGETAGENIKKGVEMVLESLKSALKTHHIEEIEAKHQSFDASVHEAISTIPANDDQESGDIIEVVEKGYRLHDRILRAAKVVVAE